MRFRAIYMRYLMAYQIKQPHNILNKGNKHMADLKKLAEDLTLPDDGAGFAGVTLAHNVGSRAEVDAVFAHAMSVGAKQVKTPRVVFWGGYSGYFADPDGHLWEVAHNPYWELQPDGSYEQRDPGAGPASGTHDALLRDSWGRAEVRRRDDGLAAAAAG